MAIADGAGLPLAITVASANPAETSLVDATLKARFLRRKITRLIGDKGYDSDKLDAQLAARGIEFIAPNRSTRRHRKQDGRQLRRYCRRWKIERLFAWLQNFRRLVTRYERHVENFLGFVQLACIVILSRQFVRSLLGLRPHRKIRLVPELATRVLAREAPVDVRPSAVGVGVPRADFFHEGRERGQASRSQAAARDEAEFNLGLVEPAAVRRCVVDRQAPPQPVAAVGAEVFDERRLEVRAQVVEH